MSCYCVWMYDNVGHKNYKSQFFYDGHKVMNYFTIWYNCTENLGHYIIVIFKENIEKIQIMNTITETICIK